VTATLALAVALAAAAAACGAGDAVRAPDGGLDRDVRACAGCHPVEAARWRASRHAAAFVDGAFHAELEPRRDAWCIGCHAPLVADPVGVRDDDARARDGVGCAACHTRHDEVVTSARCAACHQFNFAELGSGGRVVRVTDHPMQDTVAQARGADCLDCHDPHAIAGSHDAATRDGAVAVTTCVADGALRVAVRNVGAAHNVPTGGVDRHVVLRVWRSSAPERVVETVFGRVFAPADDAGKVVTADTTIAPGATRRMATALAALGGDAAEPVNVALVYVFAADEHAAIAGTQIAAPMFALRTATFAACPAE
jgi:hypothetical protein